jgi:heme/copper-type cytochrome/quinol oxidase subunit 1
LIGTLYIIFSIFAGMVGTAFSMLIRLELSTPGDSFLGTPALFSLFFGFIAYSIIFFMLVPVLTGANGNLIPRAIISLLVLVAFYWFDASSEASPGVQYLQGDHQLYNVIVTAHAFIMIFFLVMPGLLSSYWAISNILSHALHTSRTSGNSSDSKNNETSRTKGSPTSRPEPANGSEAPVHTTHHFEDPLNSRKLEKPLKIKLVYMFGLILRTGNSMWVLV